MQFFYAEGDQQRGPSDLEGLRAAGISRQTLVWKEGMSGWEEAGSVPELQSLFAAEPSVAQGMGTDAAPTPVFVYPSGPTLNTGGNASGAVGQMVAPPPGVVPYRGDPGLVIPPAQGLSIASLVCGIVAPIASLLSICIISIPGIIIGVLAVIFGHLAARQNRSVIGAAGNMAMAGLILGYLSLGLTLSFWLIVFLSIRH